MSELGTMSLLPSWWLPSIPSILLTVLCGLLTSDLRQTRPLFANYEADTKVACLGGPVLGDILLALLVWEQNFATCRGLAVMVPAKKCPFLG